jgi:hypothetical protein
MKKENKKTTWSFEQIKSLKAELAAVPAHILPNIIQYLIEISYEKKAWDIGWASITAKGVEAIKLQEEEPNVIDDRGNRVDIYCGEDVISIINREAEPIKGCEADLTYSWDNFTSSKEAMELAIKFGYSECLALALVCDLLRREPSAFHDAKDFVGLMFREQ